VVFHFPTEYHSPVNPKRPIPITLLCIAGFFACLTGMFLVYSPSVQQLGKAYALFRSMGFTFLALCFVGLWMMRRWSVWALAVYFAINQVVCLLYGLWDIATLGPLLILAISAVYYRRMR
jgi:hypothetical protein